MAERRLIVLGADGYLGWPTAMHFARRGWKVFAVDNYARRNLAQANNAEALFDTPDLPARCESFRTVTGLSIVPHLFDCTDFAALSGLVADVAPDALAHFAEQPSAPFSMRDIDAARYTLNNNLNTTFNVVWAILRNAPSCHLIKLGTMGEYGTPDIDIEEGWIEIAHKGRTDRFLFPRQGPSLYHTTKIMDTDLIHFYARTHGLTATDLMQGPVYGIHTAETRLDPALLTNFHYDDIFGTVLNRFVVQAVAGVPFTIYGSGRQVRGFLNIVDVLQCLELAADHPPAPGAFEVANQFTETFSILELAARVAEAAGQLGIETSMQHLASPRAELEEHYYNPAHEHFARLGLADHRLTRPMLVEMMETVRAHGDRIDTSRIHPRIAWSLPRPAARVAEPV
jgi:UDP-sulfoquinovose synthase